MNSCYSIWPIIHYFIFQVEHNSASLKIIWIHLVDEDTLKMADRKAELERKKKRLEEIRAAKSKKVKWVTFYEMVGIYLEIFFEIFFNLEFFESYCLLKGDRIWLLPQEWSLFDFSLKIETSCTKCFITYNNSYLNSSQNK